ncbi:3-dehydroquinate synthase II [Candidatus Bathyarchaeota archaeon]|nr:3-dehydroquinate synthase II [Candidatus Bathyarchaeota archaeon]
MRELWIELAPAHFDDGNRDLLCQAMKAARVVVTTDEYATAAKKYGAKMVASPTEGEIKLFTEISKELIDETKRVGKPVCVRVTIQHREDAAKIQAAIAAAADYILVACTDWKIIPLENIIAQAYGKVKLIAEISNAREAKLALEILELGVDGVLLKTISSHEINETLNVLKTAKTRVEEKMEAAAIPLVAAKILQTKQLNVGARVCIDTCDLMKPGEGMLIGCQSSGLFLIQAEVEENPHVEPRPFRVNAGPVSLYVLTSGNKTKYLSELKAGDEVLIVDREGKTRLTNIGRVKIEWRPLLLLEAVYGKRKIRTVVQNAETVRLVTPSGSKSVCELKPNDEVLVRIEEGGRHFGTLVREESVIET